jgi:hypothetical protein
MSNASAWDSFHTDDEYKKDNSHTMRAKDYSPKLDKPKQYDNSDSGILYKSDYDSSDFYGNYTPGNCIHCNQAQERVDIIAWINTAKDTGKKYISIKKKISKGFKK